MCLSSRFFATHRRCNIKPNNTNENVLEKYPPHQVITTKRIFSFCFHNFLFDIHLPSLSRLLSLSVFHSPSHTTLSVSFSFFLTLFSPSLLLCKYMHNNLCTSVSASVSTLFLSVSICLSVSLLFRLSPLLPGVWTCC